MRKVLRFWHIIEKSHFTASFCLYFLFFPLPPPPPLGSRKLVMFRVYLGGLLMKNIITCAVLASAALATPAFAQDEADKGMYFQLRTGVADLNNPDFAIIDTWSEPNNRLDTKLNTKSAATFGGELGYDFGGVRVGLELAYQRNKVKEIGKHTSELQSLMRISYAVFCLKKKN